MLEKPSLIVRIAIGKLVGLVIGLIGFITMPYFWPEADWLVRWGILLWYTTLGAIVGMFGVFSWHPVLNLPMPWWIRAPLLCAWMNFVLTFFAYDMMKDALRSMFGREGPLTSPFWFTLEGAVVGLIIGFFATWIGGEGKDAVDR